MLRLLLSTLFAVLLAASSAETYTVKGMALVVPSHVISILAAGSSVASHLKGLVLALESICSTQLCLRLSHVHHSWVCFDATACI